MAFSPLADVCISAPAFALSGGSPAGGTYSGTGVSGGIFNPATAGAGTFTITYSYTDGNSCTNTASNTIEVISDPVVTASTVDDQICYGSSATLNAGGASAYTWTPGGSTLSTPVVTPPITTTYTVTGTASGCTGSAAVTVTVVPLPVIDASIIIESCDGAHDASIHLTVSSGIPPYSALWDHGPGLIDLGNLGAGSYHVIITDSLGCTEDVTFVVATSPEPCYIPHIYVPNIFSPNGDGMNDIFAVRGMGITSLSLVIFDRWGEKVFESKNAWEVWDGTFREKDAEPGVYFYSLKIELETGESISESGNVTLVR